MGRACSTERMGSGGLANSASNTDLIAPPGRKREPITAGRNGLAARTFGSSGVEWALTIYVSPVLLVA